MLSALCKSSDQEELSAEINIHLPLLKNQHTSAVLIFPKLSICLDCGSTNFAVPRTELSLVREGVCARRLEQGPELNRRGPTLYDPA
jgi:hypothetical protein